MSIVLDIVYLLLLLIASPFILVRMALSARWRSGWKERLGGVPARQGTKPCIWVHAVSVGEVAAARPLLDLLAAEHPDWDVRLSTTTNTGQQVARRAWGAERCFYFPLDISFLLKRVFDRVRPDIIVLLELEIWPNFLRMARRRGIPVVIVNGRMREERVKTYRRLRFLFAPALEAASRNVACVQNDTYRKRFVRAGFAPEMLRVTGNMKYDAVQTQVAAEGIAAIRAAFGLALGETVWAAGCTWPGEEEICLRVHRELLRDHPGLRLAIAPRHVERAGEVEQAIRRAGFDCVRRSRQTASVAATEPCEGSDKPAQGLSAPPSSAVCLLDTVGELVYVYAVSSFVFVGKSLAACGGHNILEPAAQGVPPVFGPHYDNFQEEAEWLLAVGGAECVRSESELACAAGRLLADPELRRARGSKARAALDEKRGAARRHLQLLQTMLSTRDHSISEGT